MDSGTELRWRGWKPRKGVVAVPDFCTSDRDGPILTVTINRPDVMNALHPLANLELEEIFNGVKGFKPLHFKRRGKIEWDDNIEMTGILPPERVESNHSMPNCHDRYDLLEVDMLKCPKCGEVEPSYNLNVQGDNLDAKVKCIHCRTNSENGKWEVQYVMV